MRKEPKQNKSEKTEEARLRNNRYQQTIDEDEPVVVTAGDNPLSVFEKKYASLTAQLA